jgi:hypothetical protein
MSETELPGNQEDEHANGAAARRRKRVVAREVDAPQIEDPPPASVEDEARLPATIPDSEPDFVIQIPPSDRGIEPAPPAHEHDSTPVLDPTILGYRQRRHRHHHVYRWTQMLTMLCAAAAAAGVICTMVDEPFAGRIVAGAAGVVGVVAVLLSTRTSLSARWRGWAVAALVFALVALGLTWLHGLVTEHEGENAPPPRRTAA